MKNLNILVAMICVFYLCACSNSTPKLVSDLVKLQIPVIQPSADGKNRGEKYYASIYKSNDEMINDLTSILKRKYLFDTDVRDMFDVHSQAYQVYASLTNLERAGLINAQYYNERNEEGLTKLHESLTPFESELK